MAARLTRVGDTTVNMARRHVPSSRLDMTCLIIKEEIRFKFAQRLPFVQATQKHGFIDIGVPVLCMHAPMEIISKVDLYETHRGFYEFLVAKMD